MKKQLLKLITVLVALSTSLFLVTSCALVTRNMDRDMAQVVATVQISDDILADEISKRDMLAGYASYGYNYVESYGYTPSAAYALVLETLIQNRVIIQQSKLQVADNYANHPTASENDATLQLLFDDGYLPMLATTEEIAEFEKTNTDKNGSDEYLQALNVFMNDKYKDVDTVSANDAPFRFASCHDIYKAISDSKENINALIDSNATEENNEDAEEYENITTTPRVTPTIEEKEEEDKEVDFYRETKIDFEGDRIELFAESFKQFKKIGIIDSSADYSYKNEVSILFVPYFANSINSTLEAGIVTLYEEGLESDNNLNYTEATEDAEKADILDKLWERYETLKTNQEALYNGNGASSSYETALGSVGDNSFVVYHPVTGYSYVSHLLINIDSDNLEIINGFSTEDNATEESVQAKVNELMLDKIEIKDLRSSWVTSNYGKYTIKNGEGVFTFDDDYVTNEFMKEFMGTIGSVDTYTTKDEDDKDVANFLLRDIEASSMNYTQFIDLVEKVLGTTEDINFGDVEQLDGYTANSLRISNEDFDNFEDLKFAFSGDDGNLNKYLGYVYSPLTSDTQYVKSFASAAKAVTEAGVGAFQVVASKEYGLHIIMCTAKADYAVYENKDDFKADLEKTVTEDGEEVADETTPAYLFMQANIDLVTSTYIQDQAQAFINTATAEGAKTESGKLIIEKFLKAYDNLVTDEADQK